MTFVKRAHFRLLGYNRRIVSSTAMINPAMVVIRAESFPSEEKREIRKETTRPTIPERWGE